MEETVVDISSHTNTATKTKDHPSFAEAYIRLRTKEERIYTDDELLNLPDISPQHRYYKEWNLRKKSSAKLKAWLEKKIKPLSILEAGCGNGWLSRHLSDIPLSKITGLDINKPELLQAKRVFGHVPNLQFQYGEIDAAPVKEEHYDRIVFASSIQYFPSLKQLLGTSLQLLKPGGEIHILDSPFYQQHEIKEAQERTNQYFNDIGFPEMAEYYFHHSLDELAPFHYSVLYKPGFINRYLLMNKNPFPWICIKKQ